MKQWVGYTILVGIIIICWGGGIGIALNSYDKTGVWVSFLVGAIFATMLIYAVVYELRKFRRRKLIDRNYDEIMTTLVRIEMLGEDHFYVHTKWTDPDGGAEYYFKSDYITIDPTNLVNGRQIPVRMSRKDHSLYYVDLSVLKKNSQSYSTDLEESLGINQDIHQQNRLNSTAKITPQVDPMVSGTDIGKVLIYFLGAFGVAGIFSILTFFITGEIAFIAVGIFFSIVWIPVIMIARQRSIQTDLVHNGHKLLTKIEEVIYEETTNEHGNLNRSLEIKGFYQVKTSWYDDKSDTLYYFRSQRLITNPESYLLGMAGIDVYVNRHDYSQNYMDLSFLPPQFHIRKI